MEFEQGDLVQDTPECVHVRRYEAGRDLTNLCLSLAVDCEEDMLANLKAIRGQNPTAITWLYRNGIKALPWFTCVPLRNNEWNDCTR